ncbi:hypothetical protein Vafri_13809 [Volvox africanus]|uniref:Uncharacterized protein n=1 Tax=Volvox africanus TaxID=51714 RepID=A0A8J4F408_9CHLO|nr:hypothetical protein Vafri_13809 [Volvox africanus]GIL58842.1 hypothetical protein Vafri_13809 [Volvox africanus]
MLTCCEVKKALVNNGSNRTCAPPTVASHSASLNVITSFSISGVTVVPPDTASLCARIQRLLTTAIRCADSMEGEMPPATSVPRPTLRPRERAWLTLPAGAMRGGFGQKV